jgi:hypothetical protein
MSSRKAYVPPLRQSVLLPQAWTGGTKIELELPKSRTEIATERKLGIKPKSDEIAVSHWRHQPAACNTPGCGS